MDDAEVNPAREKSKRSYADTPVLRTEHSEGLIARMIEQQTAKIPSEVFLVAALGSMAASLLLETRHSPRLANFVGMWAAPLLVMGVYNKLVKIAGTS
ncbi:MAG TPA: hypothetical protein VGG33_02935 [Polyangia bacterium]